MGEGGGGGHGDSRTHDRRRWPRKGSRVDVEAEGRQYHLRKLIASGGFSQIFSAEDLESGEKVAIKRIACHSRTEVNRTLREIQCHQRFSSSPTSNGVDTSHPTSTSSNHIMPLLGTQEERALIGSSTATIFSLVFPLCRAGTLQDELTERLPTRQWIKQERVLNLFSQVCKAVEVLHRASTAICHRDLKPANLLYRSEDHLLLTDFGSACECPIRISTPKQSRQLIDEAAELSTMPYRAPELFVCEVGSTIDQSVDVWALGCVLYALCFFCSPYDEVHARGDSVALAVQSARLNFDGEAPFDALLKELISSLIKVEARERPAISEILKRVNSLRQQ